MDKSKAHDTLHMWNGGKSESCPVCSGTLTTDEQVIAEALKIAAEQFHPTINPMLSIDNTVLTDEEGKKEDVATPAQESTDVPTDAQETGAVTEESTVKAGEASDKPAATVESKTPTVSVMTDVMSFSEDTKTVPTRIKIIPAGKFNTPKYGELEIGVDKLREMKENFDKDVRAHGSTTGLPIDIEHGETAHRDAAAGWMKQLNVFDDGLYADVEWTSLGEDLLKKGLYKFFSPEFVFEYLSNEQSEYFANVVTGGGLVNKPLFDHSLPPIMFSEDGTTTNLTKQNTPYMLFISNQRNATVSTAGQNSTLEASEKDQKPMDLQKILSTPKNERSSDEQLFVAASLDQLTDEQKVAEGFVVTASESKTEETPATPEAPVVSTPEDSNPVKGEQTIAAAEKANQVVISASELATLKAAADQGKLAFSELRKAQLTTEVKALQFSENGGRIAPAQVEPIVSLMMTMSEPQQAQLKAILESLPERKVFGEMGSDQDIDKSKAADILTAKISEKTQELLKANTNLTFAEATRQASLAVTAENPDLYKDSKHVKSSY